MKEETKRKLDDVKEFVLGRCIGNGIYNTIDHVYNKGFDQGMNCCFNLMMNENAENSEVIKALVDFNIKHCENH